MGVAIGQKVPDSHRKSVLIDTYDRISCVSPSPVSTGEKLLERGGKTKEKNSVPFSPLPFSPPLPPIPCCHPSMTVDEVVMVAVVLTIPTDAFTGA
jgi:hypothetical protein